MPVVPGSARIPSPLPRRDRELHWWCLECGVCSSCPHWVADRTLPWSSGTGDHEKTWSQQGAIYRGGQNTKGVDYQTFTLQ
jgi:hypothetical protein